MTRDPLAALEALIALGVDRVLTSGQEESALEGLDLLRDLVARAGDRIIVMVCGNLTEKNIDRVAQETKAKELHITGFVDVESGMTFRNPRVYMGGLLRPPEYTRSVTSSERIASLVRRVREMTLPVLLAALAVWMDVDPAVLRGGHEPDDGLALLQAFHSPELEVRGVSVVYGNSPLETGYPIAQEIARRFGPSGLPVLRGASSGGELGVETDASRALAEALRREELTILALGPVTNVATVLKNHPDLAPRMRQIVAVAGRRPGQKFVLGEGGTPLMDFNFELDPEGFRVLLGSGVPLTLAPFEISSKTPLAEDDIERFASAPEIADFFLEPLRDYVDWYEDRFGLRAIFPFDTLAVASLTSPAWIQCDELPDCDRVAARRRQTRARRNPTCWPGRRPASLPSGALLPHRLTRVHSDLMRRMLRR